MRPVCARVRQCMTGSGNGLRPACSSASGTRACWSRTAPPRGSTGHGFSPRETNRAQRRPDEGFAAAPPMYGAKTAPKPRSRGSPLFILAQNTHRRCNTLGDTKGASQYFPSLAVTARRPWIGRNSAENAATVSVPFIRCSLIQAFSA